MGKSFDYRQLTIRVPPKIYKRIEELSQRWSTTIQDTILLILVDYFEGDTYEG